VVINSIVYAEVSIGFDRIEDLDDVLPAQDFRREELPYEAGFLAGKAFLAYRKRGGQKRSPLPDFYIALSYPRLSAADPRCTSVPDLLPDRRAHRAWPEWTSGDQSSERPDQLLS